VVGLQETVLPDEAWESFSRWTVSVHVECAVTAAKWTSWKFFLSVIALHQNTRPRLPSWGPDAASSPLPASTAHMDAMVQHGPEERVAGGKEQGRAVALGRDRS